MEQQPRVLEKHFDSTYNRPYYHDMKSGESLWDLPTDEKVEVIDKTED
jgi:hypothetical protein